MKEIEILIKELDRNEFEKGDYFCFQDTFVIDPKNQERNHLLNLKSTYKWVDEDFNSDEAKQLFMNYIQGPWKNET